MGCSVILGMHRSGTSLVAGICRCLGTDMGTVLRIGDQSNPDGYFEDLDWRALNKWAINNAGGTWYDPPSRAEITRHIHRIYPIIQALVEWKSKKQSWGFKDPRTCLTIHTLHVFLPSPRYVIVKRPTKEIVDSLMRRADQRGYKEPKRHWIALTEQYLARIESFVEECDPNFIEVEYANLVNRETAWDTVTYIAGFLELPPANREKAMELIRFRE